MCERSIDHCIICGKEFYSQTLCIRLQKCPECRSREKEILYFLNKVETEKQQRFKNRIGRKVKK